MMQTTFASSTCEDVRRDGLTPLARETPATSDSASRVRDGGSPLCRPTDFCFLGRPPRSVVSKCSHTQQFYSVCGVQVKMFAVVRKTAEPWAALMRLIWLKHAWQTSGGCTLLSSWSMSVPWHAAMVFCSCVVALILLQNVSHTLGNALPAHGHGNLQVFAGSFWRTK